MCGFLKCPDPLQPAVGFLSRFRFQCLLCFPYTLTVYVDFWSYGGALELMFSFRLSRLVGAKLSTLREPLLLFLLKARCVRLKPLSFCCHSFGYIFWLSVKRLFLYAAVRANWRFSWSRTHRAFVKLQCYKSQLIPIVTERKIEATVFIPPIWKNA